jgi:hypothetical protein
VDRLANKKFMTSGRYRKLIGFDTKPGMARYVAEAESRDEVRPILLLRAMASEILGEKQVRHLTDDPY